MCGFLGSYFVFLFGSEGFAIAGGCGDWNSGLTARSPAVGCEEGIVEAVVRFN
jgi:hypothetical protein